MECQVVITDILTAIRDLDNWAACTPVDKDLACTLQLSSPYTKPDPLGVVAIFGAWNYPVQLILLPLIGAIAAGNAVLMKPSEVAMATSNLFAKHLPKYLDQVSEALSMYFAWRTVTLFIQSEGNVRMMAFYRYSRASVLMSIMHHLLISLPPFASLPSPTVSTPPAPPLHVGVFPCGDWREGCGSGSAGAPL